MKNTSNTKTLDKDKRIEIFKKIQLLKSLVIVEEDFFSIDTSRYEPEYEVYNNLVFSGTQTIVTFHRIIDYILFSHENLNNNYTHDGMIKQVNSLLSSSAELTQQSIDNWLSILMNQPQKEFWVYKIIEGAKLSNNESVILGPFHIYDREIHKEHIINNSDYLDSKWDEIWKHCPKGLIIGIKLSAIEIDKCYQLSESSFSLFENIIKFLYPFHNQTPEVSIVKISDYRIDKTYLLNPDDYLFSSQVVKTNFRLVNFNDPYFINPPNRFKHLIEIIEKPTKNEIDKRILKAINWFGKGLREPEMERAFIQLMFSLESLLNFRDKEIIEPSILSKISELIAFTIGNDFHARKELAKEFKHLYCIRSAIAHGDTKAISEGDFISLINIVSNMIWQFIKNDDINKLSKFQDYLDWIERKKFT